MAFRVTPSGEFSLLHTFWGAVDGWGIYGALIQATDGNLYGTAAWGGANNLGTVFRMNPEGTVSVLHHFGGPDGAHPGASLIQATGGKLMGTTAGSPFSAPTAFGISTNGEFALLHEFDPKTQPSGLIEAPDGNFYGEAAGGGEEGVGTIFRLTPSGEVTTLHSFVRSDGVGPVGGLAKDAGDPLYGVTRGGGVGGTGTVFQIDSTGDFLSIQSFENEGEPVGLSTHLVQATDGTMYGVSDYGGQHGTGTVFKLNAYGELNTIHSFSAGGRQQSLFSSHTSTGRKALRYGGLRRASGLWHRLRDHRVWRFHRDPSIQRDRRRKSGSGSASSGGCHLLWNDLERGRRVRNRFRDGCVRQHRASRYLRLVERSVPSRTARSGKRLALRNG